MAKKQDPGTPKGASGAAMRELHERIRKSRERDPSAGKQHNKLSQPQDRWQRAVRYNWDKNRGRG